MSVFDNEGKKSKKKINDDFTYMARESLAYKIVRYVFLVLASLFVIIPLIPLIFMAFKTGAEYSSTSVLEAPKSFFNFYNFKYALDVGNLGKAFAEIESKAANGSHAVRNGDTRQAVTPAERRIPNSSQTFR